MPAAVPHCRYTGEDNVYEVSARVVHAQDAVVLDFGLRAYDDHLILVDGRRLEVGDQVAGLISLSVDHFAYFEELAKKPGMPALVYAWAVNEIELDTTPLITIWPEDDRYPTDLAPAGPVSVRDLTKRRSRFIDQTRMWDDEPEGIGWYRLHCTLRDTEPSHTLSQHG